MTRKLDLSLSSRLRHSELRNIAVYGLATGFAALLTLVLTRVLWRALTPADFGLWSLVDPMLVPAASLILFGIDHSIVKQLKVDRLSLQVVTGTLLASTLPSSAACLLVVGLVARFAFHLAWTDALLLTMAGEALILMMQTAFRATGAVTLFATLLLSRNLLYLAALLAAQALQDAGSLPIGLVFLTRSGCVLLVSLAALVVLRPPLRINWPRYFDALRYGTPLLLTTLIYALTDMTDRWFLAEFTGVVAVGVYSLHLKVAAILSQAIVIPFGLWLPPERFKRLSDPDGGRRFFIRTAVVLAVICGYLSGVVWLARDLVLSLIAPGIATSPLILACCLASVTCLALSQALNVGLLMPGHTGKNVVCNVYTGAATVLVAAVLVPPFGIAGAAASRMAGGLVLVGVAARMSNRVFPVAFPFVSIATYLATSVATASSIDALSPSHGMVATLLELVAWTAATALSAVILAARLRTATRTAA